MFCPICPIEKTTLTNKIRPKGVCQLSDPGPNSVSLDVLSLGHILGALSCQVNNPATLWERQHMRPA